MKCDVSHDSNRVEHVAGVFRALPLDSPVHHAVGDDERGDNVENLVAEATESVEDGGVEGTGEGPLAVGREGVGRNALGGRAACINEV